MPELDTWTEHTTGPFALRVLAGGHFYLTDHQRQVTQIVSEHRDSRPCRAVMIGTYLASVRARHHWRGRRCRSSGNVVPRSA